MALKFTTRDELVKRVGDEARLLAFANQSEANITDAIERATDRIRNAALNRLSATVLDALTAVTVNLETNERCAWIALYILTSGGNEQPEDIIRNYTDAQAWLGWLATGKARLADTVDSTAGGSPSQGVRSSLPSLTFDITDEDSAYRARDWDI